MLVMYVSRWNAQRLGREGKAAKHVPKNCHFEPWRQLTPVVASTTIPSPIVSPSQSPLPEEPCNRDP